MPSLFHHCPPSARMGRLCLTLIFLFVAARLGAELPQGWRVRPRQDDGKGALTAPATLRDGEALALPVRLPSGYEYVVTEPQKTLRLAEFARLTLRLRPPQELSERTTLTVFSKDSDYLWRQLRMGLWMLPRDEQGTVTLTIPLAGDEAVRSWEPCGHGRPWNALTAAQLLEFGFRFELDGDSGNPRDAGVAEFLEATLDGQAAAPPTAFRDVQVRGLTTTRVGDRLELSFRLDGWLQTPYDSSRLVIAAVVTPPGGAPSETVRGYYHEDFLYDAGNPDKVSCLTPAGEPLYRVRYCPRRPGRHTMAVTVTCDGARLAMPPFDFEVQPAPPEYRGFVRVDERHRSYFRLDDGSVFDGIGMNVRSPFDDRYFHVAPYSSWRDQGLAAYDRLFAEYGRLGINVVEVWMCSWWLALEWRNEAPGFHGVGHYSQYRAWMLDHILDLAERNGIRLILVLNNHGKFGMTYDTEWAFNPYSKANGGYLDKCEHYFSDARAKADFKRVADYIVARWGASPNLLAWKLFTEVDLTGQNIQAYLTDPNISKWHAEMGAYLHAIDLYRHPVTTHWMLSYHRIDHPTASVKELDFLSTDAYYQGGGTQQMLALITGATDFGKRYGKPLVITEFGGSSYGDSIWNLMNQVEAGLWTGYFHEMGILPMYWWFALVEDKRLQPVYAALKAFSRGEDRRGMAPATRSTSAAGVVATELRSPDRLLLWVMDQSFFFQAPENAVPPSREGLTLTVPPLSELGDYRLEFWNTATGERSDGPTVKAEKGKPLVIRLPAFRRSLAVKLVRP